MKSTILRIQITIMFTTNYMNVVVFTIFKEKENSVVYSRMNTYKTCKYVRKPRDTQWRVVLYK